MLHQNFIVTVCVTFTKRYLLFFFIYMSNFALNLIEVVPQLCIKVNHKILT